MYSKFEKGYLLGMFVLGGENNQLDLVYIAGPVEPTKFSKLGGTLGIPKNIGKSVGGNNSK